MTAFCSGSLPAATTSPSSAGVRFWIIHWVMSSVRVALVGRLPGHDPVALVEDVVLVREDRPGLILERVVVLVGVGDLLVAAEPTAPRDDVQGVLVVAVEARDARARADPGSAARRSPSWGIRPSALYSRSLAATYSGGVSSSNCFVSVARSSASSRTLRSTGCFGWRPRIAMTCASIASYRAVGSTLAAGRGAGGRGRRGRRGWRRRWAGTGRRGGASRQDQDQEQRERCPKAAAAGRRRRVEVVHRRDCRTGLPMRPPTRLAVATPDERPSRRSSGSPSRRIGDEQRTTPIHTHAEGVCSPGHVPPGGGSGTSLPSQHQSRCRIGRHRHARPRDRVPARGPLHRGGRAAARTRRPARAGVRPGGRHVAHS